MRNEEFSAWQSEADAAAAADTAPWFSFDGLQTRIKRATFGRTKRNLSLFFSKNFRWLISFYSGTEKKWIPKSPASDWPVQGFCLKNKSSQVKPTSHEPATVRMAINCRRPNFYDSRFHEFLNGPFMTIGQFIIRTRTGPRRSIFFRKVVNSITMEASFHRRWSTDQLRLDWNCKSRSVWLFFVHYHESHRWWTHSGPSKMSFRIFFRFYFHKCDFL